MADMASMPLLRTTVTDAGIRLQLGTWSYGNGVSLEAAADDLVRRRPALATALRANGFKFIPEAGMPDREFVDFLWELSEVAEEPDAVRHTLFG